jgi:hypothetical protein
MTTTTTRLICDGPHCLHTDAQAIDVPRAILVPEHLAAWFREHGWAYNAGHPRCPVCAPRKAS